MYRYLIFLMASAFMLVATGSAAQPDWQVSPSNYQYTMTVIGVAVYGCTEGIDGDDLVAAFINGEVRGVQSFGTDVLDRKYAYLIVFDNDFSGSEITFKLYDASRDTVVEVVSATGFEADGNIGGFSDPYEFRTGDLEGLYLTDSLVPPDGLAGDTVAWAFGVYEDGDTVLPEIDFAGGPLGADNGYFSISGNSLVLGEDVAVAAKDSFLVHLSGMAADGCTAEGAFVIRVGGQVATGDPALFGAGGDDIAIYPNPTCNILYFDTRTAVDRICLYDHTGRLTLEARVLPGQRSIDVSGLPNGLYLASFRADGAVFTKRLAVCH